MSTSDLVIHVDAAPLKEAATLLAEFAQRAPEVVQRFLGGLDGAAQLVRVNGDGLPAGAGECRVVFEPSDLFVEFLAAGRASERDGL